jgi:tetratricopeptide (TPR) repeat protein
VAALSGAAAAVAADPEIAIGQLALGLAEARAGNMEGSESALRRASLADGYPISWANLAAVQFRRGEDEQARDSADRAFRLGRQHPEVAFEVAQVRFVAGDRAGAIEALAATLAQRPELITDPHLADGTVLPGLLEEATAQAYLVAPADLRWGISVVVNEYARARSDALALGVPERAAVLALVDALEGPASARDRLWAVAEADPAFPFGVAVAALGAQLLGDGARLDRYRAIANATSQFGTLYGRMARVRVDHTPGLLYVNESTTFYGVFTYGRRMVQDATVPWLATIVWE